MWVIPEEKIYDWFAPEFEAVSPLPVLVFVLLMVDC